MKTFSACVIVNDLRVTIIIKQENWLLFKYESKLLKTKHLAVIILSMCRRTSKL
jgi:hypothetical protein